MKHTPGPWTAVKHPPKCDIFGANGAFIAKVPTIGGRTDDAHLIAAAPDLLEALEAFAKHFGPLDDNEMLHEEARRCFGLARAAIAKARGEK